MVDGGEAGGQGLVKTHEDEVKRQVEVKKQDELKRAMSSGLAMKEIVGAQGRILERERGTSSYSASGVRLLTTRYIGAEVKS
jgi:hypothetical protein